ncbi:MAG: sodium:calcium antiporter [Thaumarchaeota archaeon]|nr:MAG: sodium:calcium antiporter [Nitrososphaerota archaeon]
MAENLLLLLSWLGELIVASWLLADGAEHLAERWGGRFVGRTLLSIATTLPEIAIVVAAAKDGSYDTALGSALGSNLFMMTLGLAVMLIIATTKLSKAPQKFVDVKQFKLDKILLVITAVVGALLFIDGFDVIDGIIFTGLFGAYLYLAFREMKQEKKETILESELHRTHETKMSKKHFGRSMILFIAGTIPIAGEMPEKISMILLARKGANGASIAVANVLGSKILNNTLLLSVAVFAAMTYRGFTTKIPNTSLLEYQMILVTVITIVALVPMFRNKLGLKSGIMLLVLYGIGIGFQFILPSL